jgi:small nuclear ribonucleoprotein (snRNP)-like protein
MSIPPVKDFFSNKVNLQLKSGQRFEGLLSRIDYKTNTVILEDVEDLGNEHDKNCIPHDKKIVEKAFECDSIAEIFLKEKHFSEPKKYKKEEFWDAISEPQPQPHKKYRAKHEEEREYKPKRNYDNRNKREYEKR